MKTNVSVKRIVLALVVVSLVSACAVSRTDRAARHVEKSAPPNPQYYDESAALAASIDKEKNSGSLWVDSYASNLYANMYRASKVGDTVTVVISEQVTGAREAKTNTKKKSENTSSIDALGNLMSKLTSVIAGLNPAELIKAKTENKFEGQGKIDSKGSLFASLSCRVQNKLSNGDLVIRGEKRVKISKDEQILILEGIIRPYDINPDNTVSSVSVADAKISYTGMGVVAERQSPGWLARVLDYIWPF